MDAGVDSRIRYEVVDALKEFIATFKLLVANVIVLKVFMGNRYHERTVLISLQVQGV